jgi:flavorubredoxin
VKKLPGGFRFNHYLIDDDEPLLFHTGPGKLLPPVREAIRRVIPAEQLSHIGLSHFEADECGSLNEFLAVSFHCRAALRQDRRARLGQRCRRP